MYLDFFKFRDFPFRLTPDCDFLYMSPAHSRAKAYMDYAIWNRDGFVVITGDIGCGKTTLIQKLLSELDQESVLVAKIFQTQLDEVEFLQAVLVEFGLNPFNAKKVELIDMLNTVLVDHFMKLKQIVLIVDDAHNLSPKVLEEIRMLSGLETRKEKILHIILVGQPQLNELLESPGMEQLLQRVRLRYKIRSLTEAELPDYINYRLRVAGCEQPVSVIGQNAYPVIHKYTGGVPRLINTLCDTALTVAYADGVEKITGDTIQAACDELQWVPFAKRAATPTAPTNDTSDVANLLREQIRMLHSIESKMSGLDSLVPTLNALSKQLGGFGTAFKSLADKLPAAAAPEREAEKRPSGKSDRFGTKG